MAHHSMALRRLLIWLWQEHGAPKLNDLLVKRQGPRPRNKVVERDALDRLLAAAPPHLRLLILLCSDMAMRSGTASRVGPDDWSPERQEFRFETKFGTKQTLPATAEIAELIGKCSMESQQSFVRQLWPRNNPETPAVVAAASLRQQYGALAKRLNLDRGTRLHDLRRTTAVAVLKHTHDLRDVQAVLGHRSLVSTLWYLDHDLRPVKRSTLEIIKRPAWAKRGTG